MKKPDSGTLMFAAMIATCLYAIWAWHDAQVAHSKPYEPMDEIRKIVNP